MPITTPTVIVPTTISMAMATKGFVPLATRINGNRASAPVNTSAAASVLNR
jgi:hypothetical protein